MQLEPYLFFYGRTEEALNFYKDVFRGEITQLNRFEGSPMESEMPPEAKKQIMHATFKGPGFSFMASEGRRTGPEGENNVSLSIYEKDGAEAKRIFDRLADGGNVAMPLQDAFWGGKFGMTTDKFGIDWMVSTD